MAVFRSVRVQMRDRPGALSALGAAFAALSVDIVRLDVVSHQGSIVVDDLYLRGASESDIDRALGGIMDAESVLAFDGFSTDPARRMAERLGAVLGARGLVAARGAAVAGAMDILYAQAALLLRVAPGGEITQLVGRPSVPEIGADEAFAGRWALMNTSATAFAARGEWAPSGFRNTLGAAWVAVTPCGVADLLVVARTVEMPILGGELARLAAFSVAAARTFALLGDSAAPPGWGSGRLNLPGDAVKSRVAA